MTIIHLGQPSPTASSNLPGSPLGTGGADKPRTPLFGLAPGGVYRAANCCQSRGALLPHHFTLTGQGLEDDCRRYIFCGTFHGLTPPRRYLAPCPKEPGLSSASFRRTAIVWPTPALSGAKSTRLRGAMSGTVIARRDEKQKARIEFGDVFEDHARRVRRWI